MASCSRKKHDRVEADVTLVRVESQAGYWTSGWLPVVDGFFTVKTQLREGKICPFQIYARDATGRSLEVTPNELTIRHGLDLTAPPLPHTISVEVVRPTGRLELDPIFPRNTPLPAEKHIQYRADRTLRPGEAGTAVTVKLWEGEEFAEPDANEWVGNVQITSCARFLGPGEIHGWRLGASGRSNKNLRRVCPSEELLQTYRKVEECD